MPGSMTAHPTVTPDGRGRAYWSGRFAVAASALVYLGITAVIGRDILAGPTRIIASDTGDPVLTAVVLMWNATHVPGIGQW